MARTVLIFMSFFAMSGNAWAWGDEGHKIVCEIAMRLAVPSTRAEIRRLIKTDSEFDFFSDFLHMARPSTETRRRTLHKSCTKFEWASIERTLSACARMRLIGHQGGGRASCLLTAPTMKRG